MPIQPLGNDLENSFEDEEYIGELNSNLHPLIVFVQLDGRHYRTEQDLDNDQEVEPLLLSEPNDFLTERHLITEKIQ